MPIVLEQKIRARASSFELGSRNVSLSITEIASFIFGYLFKWEKHAHTRFDFGLKSDLSTDIIASSMVFAFLSVLCSYSVYRLCNLLKLSSIKLLEEMKSLYALHMICFVTLTIALSNFLIHFT